MSRSYVRMARWLTIPAIVAVVVVILLSAGQTPTVQPSAITRAADVTGHVAGADLAGSVTINGAGRSITMNMSGSESFATRNGELTLQLNGIPGLSTSSASFEMRFLYPVYYMRSALFSSALPTGKQWVRFNVAQALRKQGLNPAVLSSAQSDPAQYLQYLRATSGGVQNLGTEQIRGVATTHYHAVTDLRRYATLLPTSQRAAAEQGFARLAQVTGTKSIPIDVWIDSAHLIRQMRINLALHPSAGTLTGQAVKEAVTVDLFNFGPKQAVTPPPSGQVEDLSALTGAGA